MSDVCKTTVRVHPDDWELFVELYPEASFEPVSNRDGSFWFEISSANYGNTGELHAAAGKGCRFFAINEQGSGYCAMAYANAGDGIKAARWIDPPGRPLAVVDFDGVASLGKVGEFIVARRKFFEAVAAYRDREAGIGGAS